MAGLRVPEQVPAATWELEQEERLEQEVAWVLEPVPAVEPWVLEPAVPAQVPAAWVEQVREEPALAVGNALLATGGNLK